MTLSPQDIALTVTEQRALLWLAGVLFAAFGVISWNVIRGVFTRFDRLERGLSRVHIALASHGILIEDR